MSFTKKIKSITYFFVFIFINSLFSNTENIDVIQINSREHHGSESLPAIDTAKAISANIPTIDLNDFYDEKQRADFINTLGEAFHNHGFIVVTNAGIDQKILDEAYLEVKKFFKQELKDKQEIQSKTNNGERGYVTGETPKTQPRNIVDWKEILHIGRELTEEQKVRLSYPENLWPKNLPLKNGVMPLYNNFENIMQPIAAAAAEYLGESSLLFPSMMHEGDHLLRFLHYFPNSDSTKPWGAEHTDMNFLTLIPRSSSKGLQVQLKDNSWVDIHVPVNAVVINVGDSLQHLTNGFYRSGVHRIMSTGDSSEERWSVVFHGHTRHNLDMSPLQKAIALSGGKQEYPNAYGWELLYAEIAAVGRASRPLLEVVSKSGIMERKIKYGKASVKVMQMLADEGLASEQVLKELKK